jgi:AraC-like DNA-binding protein
VFIPQNTTYSCLWQAKPIVAFHSLHFSFQPRFDPFFNTRLQIQTLPKECVPTLYEKTLRIQETQYEKNETSFFTLSTFFEICGLFLPHIHASESAVNNTVAPAVAYIERHYRKKITVEQLAELCFLSPSRFHFIFKEQTGVSPIVYKNRVAVQYASQELLSSPDVPVAEIAGKHGFSSVIYFERLFKKITGKSPSQYRREFRLS